MAKGEIKITYSLRPCIVKNKKALFHSWEQKSEIVSPSMAVGGHCGGVVSAVLGIIEYEDGTIHECYPDEIKFLDNIFSEYCWEINEKECEPNA